MINHGKYKNHSWFLGILRKFQWIGFLISTDNPITYNNYFLLEIRFLWVRMWYIYEFKDSKKKICTANGSCPYEYENKDCNDCHYWK